MIKAARGNRRCISAGVIPPRAKKRPLLAHALSAAIQCKLGASESLGEICDLRGEQVSPIEDMLSMLQQKEIKGECATWMSGLERTILTKAADELHGTHSSLNIVADALRLVAAHPESTPLHAASALMVRTPDEQRRFMDALRPQFRRMFSGNLLGDAPQPLSEVPFSGGISEGSREGSV